MMTAWFGIAAGCVLQAIDGWLTLQIIGNGGREVNPVTRAIMGRLGLVAGLVLTKAFCAALIALIIYLDQMTVAWIAIGVYAGVCAWNFVQWRRFRG